MLLACRQLISCASTGVQYSVSFPKSQAVVLVTNDMSGIVAHNLSGLGWSPLEVTNEMDRGARGDPEDAI